MDNISILIDESHREQIRLLTHKGMEEILLKLDMIPYSLIEKPISSELINDENILFIGVPEEEFLEFEIENIQRFLERENKIVIIVYGTSSESKTNFNLIIQKYGIDFAHDLVHDKENNNMGLYMPIIKNLLKHDTMKGVKKLNYSGSSLFVYDDTVLRLATSSESAIPPNSPVIAMGCDGKLIVIGGNSMFSDAEFGLPSEDNKKFVENLFKYCQKRVMGRAPTTQKAREKEERRLRKQEEKEIERQEKLLRKKEKHRETNKIFKALEKDLDVKITEMEDLGKKIDLTWTKFSEMMSNVKELEDLERLREDLNSRDASLRKELEAMRNDAFSIYREHEEAILAVQKSQEAEELINSIYVAEAEVSNKIDMIRNNLLQLFENKKAEMEKKKK